MHVNIFLIRIVLFQEYNFWSVFENQPCGMSYTNPIRMISRRPADKRLKTQKPKAVNSPRIDTLNRLATTPLVYTKFSRRVDDAGEAKKPWVFFFFNGVGLMWYASVLRCLFGGPLRAKSENSATSVVVRL